VSDYEPTQHADEQHLKAAADKSVGLPTAAGYAIERKLGSGAFGDVWLGKSEKTGVRVAVKFFRHGTGHQWQSVIEEISHLAELHSEPGIVRLIDVNSKASQPHYVMDYAEGGSLAQRLADGPLPVREALRIFHQITAALAFVHAKKICHCDLKPANVLLDGRGRARVADFGQAHLSHDASPALGTFFYMAPEQTDLSRSRPNARLDVYGLGAILYAMLTGTPPREDAASTEELRQTADLGRRLNLYRETICKAPDPTAHRRVPGVDKPLARIVERCLHLDASQRPRDAQELLELLEARRCDRKDKSLLGYGLAVPLALVMALTTASFYAGRIAINSAEDSLCERVLLANRVTANLIASVVGEQLNDLLDDVRRKAEDNALTKALIENERGILADRVRWFSTNSPQSRFTDWAVANSNGVIMAMFPEDEKVVGGNFSHRDWFNGTGEMEPAENATPFPPVRSDWVSEPYVQKARKNPQVVALSHPVKEAGQVVGVLRATVNLEELHMWLKIAEGDTGFPVLINNRHQFVRQGRRPGSSPEEGALEYGVRAKRWTNGCRFFDVVLKAESSNTNEFQYPGEERWYLAGYSRVKACQASGWSAVYLHDKEKVLAPMVEALRSRMNMLGGMAFVVAIFLVLGLWTVLVWRSRQDREVLDA